MATATDKRGLKRVCVECGTRFYDFHKRPILCPHCETEFTTESKVKSRRGRNTVANDDAGQVKKKTEADTDKKDENQNDDNDEDTVSLDDVDDGNDDSDDDENIDLGEDDLDNIDDDDMPDLDDDLDDDDMDNLPKNKGSSDDDK